jgi:hypothetical protein
VPNGTIEGIESRSDVSRVRETARQGRAASVATAIEERLTNPDDSSEFYNKEPAPQLSGTGAGDH